MGFSTRIPMGHNMNCYGQKNVINRMYAVPTSWNPPAYKGIRKGRTNDITMLYAPTPPKGNGDPRVKGKRIVNPLLRTEMYVG